MTRHFLRVLSATVFLVFIAFGAFAQTGNKPYYFSYTGSWDLSRGRIAPEDQLKDPYFQHVANTLGVAPLTTAYEWGGGGNYDKQLRLALASGNIPEAFAPWTLQLLDELIKQGMLLPLDDYLKKDAPNLYKYVPEATWNLIRSFSPDKKIYWIPKIWGDTTTRVGLVRKDWLDAIGKPIPRTKEELLEVYRLIRDKDVNGNGDPNDEWPVSGRKGLRWMDDLFVMHGVAMFEGYPEWRWDEARKQMVCEQVSPQMRSSIEFLRQLYAEKLLDPDCFVMEYADWRAKAMDNRLFHFVRPVDIMGDFNIAATGSGRQWAYLPIPKVAGVIDPKMPLPIGNNVDLVITRKAKRPDLIMKWADWQFTPEGNAYMTLGLPGKDWIKESGKIVVKSLPESEYIYVMKQPFLFDPEVVQVSANGALKVELLKAGMPNMTRVLASTGMPASVYEGYPDIVPRSCPEKFAI
jgi:putative aldouronate transport system substrate-binding protein